MIQEISVALGDIPEPLVWGLLAFAALALIAQVAALVDLARRKRVLWDRKWVWILIILLISNAIGAVLWFVLGRRVPQEDPEEDTGLTGDAKGAQRAVEVLYGSADDGAHS